MKKSIPCPSCQKKLTIEHFEDFSSPFTMKCPHCRVKLKETKVTPLLICLAIIIPLLIFLGITVKNFLADYFPIVEKVPTVIVCLAFFVNFSIIMSFLHVIMRYNVL